MRVMDRELPNRHVMTNQGAAQVSLQEATMNALLVQHVPLDLLRQTEGKYATPK